jgi:hypothetical protein
MGSELSTDKYPVLKPLLEFTPDVWRDTVVVPPNGRTRIWVQYKNYTGKTIFHCHFLAHEDTGMMATLFIGPQDYVFRWKDHTQLFMGVGIGVGLLLSLVVLVVVWTVVPVVSSSSSSSSRSRGPGGVVSQNGYAAVTTMNELKSKAVD